MQVLLLTVFLSLLLAGLFFVAFIRVMKRPEAGCLERESLLPFHDEPAVPRGRTVHGATPAPEVSSNPKANP
jgi:hypothetical protein